MPAVLPRNAIDDADAAVIFARQVRKIHRRRTNKDSEQRAHDIDLALMRLREAMAPLRSEIGRFSYGPQTEIARANRASIRQASAEIQRERRKLFKMRKR